MITKHEKELAETFLRQTLGASEEATYYVRRALGNLNFNADLNAGLIEPVQSALTNAYLALKQARDSVLRAEGAVNLLLAIRDRKEN